MTLPVIQPKRRRSALETFDGCPYRYDVLYNLCTCGHRRNEHDPVTGECFGQVRPKRVRAADRPSADVIGFADPKHLPCDCEKHQPVEDRGDESQRGIAFHEMAFRYIDRLARAKTTADHEEAALAFKEGIALAQLTPALLPDVSKLWGRFVEWFQLNLRAYLTAEERQETQRFTWIPDLVYIFPNRVTIYDWKTYYKGLTKDQALREFQLKFYLLQAMEIWPNFGEYEFVFNFVRLGYQVSVVLVPDQIEAFRPEVEAILLALEEAERTNNYPAIAGDHCRICRLKCPLADNPLKLPVRLTTRDQAEQAFSRVLHMEQEIKALKKSLKGWVETEGPLVHRGQEYLFISSLRKHYPAAAVIDFLRERGIDVDGILVSRGAIGDHANPRRGQPAVLEHLGDIELADTRWKFTHRKAGELAPAGLADVLGGDDDDESAD